ERGVAVGVLIKIAFSVAVGVESEVRSCGGVGIATVGSAEVGVAAGVNPVTGDAVGVSLGVGVGVDLGVGLGVGVCVAEGDADSAGSSDSIGSLSDAGGDSSFFAAFGVVAACAVRPGSDQPLTCLPFANIACQRAFPCSLITGRSIFPRTILPV